MKRLVIAVVLIVALVVGLLLATRQRSDDEVVVEPTPAPAAAATPVPATGAPASPILPAALVVVATDDPALYAASVASGVFGMDTRSFAAADYRALLLAEADPTLTDTGLADLERLVDERVPADDLWQRMRENQQWSSFVVTQTWEPGSWEQVVTSGHAQPGWAMRNVTGVQTTHYVQSGTARESSRERTITIGMRCPAAGAEVDRCRLVLLGATVVP